MMAEWTGPSSGRRIAHEAQRGGDLILHLDLAPDGAASPVLLTLRSPIRFDLTDPDLIAWSCGEHTGGIARPDFVDATSAEESPSFSARLTTGVRITFGWSSWPDRRHA